MEKEYTTAIGYKILYGSLSLILISVALLWVIPSNNNVIHVPGLLVFPVLTIVVSVLVLINLYRRKLIISNYGIRYINIWRTKELPENAIKGFRFIDKSIIIEPISQDYSKLRIRDYLSLSPNKEMLASLDQNFQNLDQADFENNKKEILSDVSWDLPTEQKELKLNNSRKYAIRYSITAIVLFVISIYVHSSYPILPMILLIYPLFGIFLIIYSKGLINLYAKKNSANSPLIIGLIFTNVALINQSWASIKIMDYNKVIEPVGITAGIIIVLLLAIVIKKRPEKPVIQFIYAVFFAITYAIGSMLMINSNFDYSKPTPISARLIRGENSCCNLLIAEPGEFQYSSVSVSRSKFESLPSGAKVYIDIKAGLLGIPWVYSKE